MEPYELYQQGDPSSQSPRASFFTRKLAFKLRQKGIDMPPSVAAFLDTPLCCLDEKQVAYFEGKFRPLIPQLIAVLEEVYDEMGADREGWEDMLTYNVRRETPIGICARAVLVKKEREAEDILTRDLRAAQRTVRIERPLCFSEPSS